MRRVLLVAVAIAPLVLLACGDKSDSAAVQVRGRVTNYFDALNSRDPERAWSMLCESLQSQIDRAVFEEIVTGDVHRGDLVVERVEVNGDEARLAGRYIQHQRATARMRIDYAFQRRADGWCISKVSGAPDYEVTYVPAIPIIDISVRNLQLSTRALSAPPSAEISVHFQNQDQGIHHNFSVYTSRSATTILFRGDPVLGPATKYYTFTTPAAGNYFFRCDIHPDMNGSFAVR